MNFTQKRDWGMLVTNSSAMALLAERLQQNLPGRFYVDATCIDCDTCRSLAPAFFRREDEIGLSIVHRQPETPDELAHAEDARASCPTDSIGNDGDRSESTAVP